MTKVSPSILSSDFLNLQSEIGMLNASDASMIHIDVMDGVFVPNITIGFPVIKAIRAVTEKTLDVHLMIVDPDKYIDRCKDCGVDIMNVHLEACPHLDRTIHAIRDHGMTPAVTINPATPVGMLQDIITEVDMVLLMSVNPGFSGQKFIPNTLNKVRRLKALIAETGSRAQIEVDGGVNLDTGAQLVKAGADILVAGNAVFRAEDPAAYIARLAML